MAFDPHYLFFLVSVILASISQLLLKKSATIQWPSFWREYLNPWVIGGYGLLFCSVFLDICGMRGLAYLNAPMVGALGFVLVPVLASRFFGERLTRRKIIGICLIVAGMVVFYF